MKCHEYVVIRGTECKVWLSLRMFLMYPSKVSMAILAGVQSRLKLQQMYGKLFNFQTL